MIFIPPPTRQDIEAWLRRIRDPELRGLLVEYVREMGSIADESKPPMPPMPKPSDAREVTMYKCVTCGEFTPYPDSHIAASRHTEGFVRVRVPIMDEKDPELKIKLGGMRKR